jgi:hypothetical protein
MNKEYINFKTNQLELIFRKYNKKINWNMHSLSSNPNITTEIIEDYPNMGWQWNFQGVSDNINIDLDFVKNNEDKPWNNFALSKNPSLAEHIGQPDTIDWVWKYVCCNKKVSEGILEQNIEKLDWVSLSYYNCNLSWKFIEENINKNWNWDRVSSFPCINIDIVKAYPDIDWNFSVLSKNKSITIKDIKNNPQLNWDTDMICSNPNLTIEDVLQDRNLFSNWGNITSNESITQDIIEQYTNLPWDIDSIVIKSGINIDFVLKYYYLDWDWFLLSSSYSISFTDILNNYKLNWVSYGLAYNPNLTLEVFDNLYYRLKNSGQTLSENLFLYDIDMYQKSLNEDVNRRKNIVNNNIKHLFYKDICGEVLKYVGYN